MCYGTKVLLTNLLTVTHPFAGRELSYLHRTVYTGQPLFVCGRFRASSPAPTGQVWRNDRDVSCHYPRDLLGPFGAAFEDPAARGMAWVPVHDVLDLASLRLTQHELLHINVVRAVSSSPVIIDPAC